MIQSQDEFVQAVVAYMSEHDPVVQDYQAFFAPLNWEVVPERNARKPWPGRTPHPHRAYIKALLIKQREKCSGMEMLRRFLVRHPLLVLGLGFRPVQDPHALFGFDVEKTVPTTRWLNQKQRRLDNTTLQAVLGQSVQTLDDEVPDFAETVAVDTKHIYACVCENNRKECLQARYDPQRPPKGDRDCRLGVKRRFNQTDTQTDTKAEAEYLWGYGSGIMTTTHPTYGDAVLAEYTLPFNQADVEYFQPLYQRTLRHLRRAPKHLAADAAFDAWHVYEPFAQQQGIAAIPRNERGFEPPQLGANGFHLCPLGLEMSPSYRYFDKSRGHRVQMLRCPLLHPTPTDQLCDHVQFAKGRGCEKRINAEAGGRMRIALDRHSQSFRRIYRQRTSAERINAQAKALGIERPKVRNLASVRNLNTLTYIVINVHAIQRIRRIKAECPATGASPIPLLC
jgi:hypothetical protein